MGIKLVSLVSSVQVYEMVAQRGLQRRGHRLFILDWCPGLRVYGYTLRYACLLTARTSLPIADVMNTNYMTWLAGCCWLKRHMDEYM